MDPSCAQMVPTEDDEPGMCVCSGNESRAFKCCLYGQYTVGDVSCTRGRGADDVNRYKCRCVSELEARDNLQWKKNGLLIGGGCSLAVGLLLVVPMYLKREWLTACAIRNHNRKNACIPSCQISDTGSGSVATCCVVFWTWYLYPAAGLIAGVVLLAMGGSVDTSSFWMGCG